VGDAPPRFVADDMEAVVASASMTSTMSSATARFE